MEHQRFVLKLLQSTLPIIVCLRAKQKSTQTKGTQEMFDAGIIEKKSIGRTVVVKDDYTSPIQNEHFISEMMCYMEILRDHTIRVVKHSHPTLRACFPEDFKEPIGIKHGEALAAWCANPGKAATQSGPIAGSSPSPAEDPAMKAIAAANKLRARTLEVLRGEKFTDDQLLGYCIDKAIIMPVEGLDAWPASRLPADKAGMEALIKSVNDWVS
jgi:hypothetical protein